MFGSRKVKILTVLMLVCISTALFSQANVTVDISDDVYNFLKIAETKGYCERLPNARPYTQKFIISVLKEIKEAILDSEDSRIRDSELQTVEYYLSRYTDRDGVDVTRLAYKETTMVGDVPLSFEFSNTDEAFITGGLYSDSSLNASGYELFHNLNFIGDIGKNVSYRSTAYVGLTKMDLQQVGSDYLIGYWWYDDYRLNTSLDPDDPDGMPQARTINTFRNNAVFPYSYRKKWDGSVYYLSNLNANGLEGWPFDPAIAFGMYGDLRGSFLDDHLTVGMGRIYHEWGAMDINSSLVLNSNAAPMMSVDASIKLLPWLSFDTLTGICEFPNADYINHNAWSGAWRDRDDDGEGNNRNNYPVVDSMFFQNAYSIGMFNFDWTNWHFDFGSTCIWPKRFELGYMFPLIDRVVYQNSVGDFDNLALFGNLKGTLPGIGSAWISSYIEELNSLSPHLFTWTRCMFAYQGGAKVNLPFLPFGTLSARYTKIEPFCYTHQAIRKQPWYDDYISEAYMNNDRSIGYYLQPNSDEFFVRFETMPLPASSFGLQYQLIRHGADYGSNAVPGSSIWSELKATGRDSLRKYFLHDGAYEWTNVIKLEGSCSTKILDVPVQFTANVGYVYDFWTSSGVNDNKKHAYHKINTAEYPVKQGVVASLGIKLFAFERAQ
ncbi:MAG: hypothetical protein KBT02_00700 [Treponema sp.]|nr:hypothetical protein [Candidatus Treponema caballi]